MNHRDAESAGTVERYILGELRGAARDEFEEHFFECAECAEAVRTGTALADNAAAEWKSAPAPAAERPVAKPARRAWWWPQLAWAAVPALALLTVSVLWVRDHRKLQGEVELALAPQPFHSVQLDVVRGGDGAAVVTRNSRFFAVSFYIQPDSLPEYAVEISGDGAAPATVLIPQQKDQRYNLLLPLARYGPGLYSIDVRGGPGTDGRAVQHFPLRLK